MSLNQNFPKVRITLILENESKLLKLLATSVRNENQEVFVNKEKGESLVKEFLDDISIRYEIGPSKMNTVINTISDLLISIELAEKVLIVDWDVHHGNGTQHIFEGDPSVFYYSLHQYPYYPGSGSETEKGIGEGIDFTLNRPLRAGATDKSYIDAIEHDLEKIEKNFKADLILISAGFDAHRDDPLAGMLVSEDGFWKFTELVSRYAWRHADGRILSVLEGGYNLRALTDSTLAHIDCLLKH